MTGGESPCRDSVFTLVKCVSVGYTIWAMKDVGLRIRVQRELREQFLEACRAQDKPAAQVLREFMREYVERCRTDSPEKSGVSQIKKASF